MVLREDIRGVTGSFRRRAVFKIRARLPLGVLAFVSFFAALSLVHAQDTPPNPEPPAAPAPADLPGQVVLNTAGQCVQPPPMVQIKDYNGPFSKVVGTFTQKLDRQSVHVPHYKQGLVLCSLEI